MKETADFLFEIGCEEIPAGMLPGAIKELEVILEKYLTAHNLIARLSDRSLRGAAQAGCSRARDLRVKQPDETKEITGPPKSVSYDAAGKPTRAAESFAQKMDLPIGKAGHNLDSEGGISLRETSDRGEDRQRKYLRTSSARGRGDPLAAKHVLDRQPPGCISSGRFAGWWRLLGGKPLRFTLGDAAAGNEFIRPPIPRQDQRSLCEARRITSKS